MPHDLPPSVFEAHPHLVAARTVYGEARGDPASQEAIAHVILNRLNSGRFGKTIHDVVLKPKQFSAWNPTDPNREVMLRTPAADPRYGKVRDLVLRALSGETPDPTGGAEFYHARGVTPKDWDFSQLEPAGEFGKHLFYRRRAR
jgi:N-acetylmuramoyl-L-alanine amidase